MFPTIHGVVSQALAAGVAPPAAQPGGPAVYNETGWSTISLSNQVGWRFTVGSANITVHSLRFYHASGATETVRLWRVIDGALLASASVTSTGGWGEEEITPVTLLAGAQYVVAARAGGSSRTVHHTPTNAAIDPAITYDTGVSDTGSALPATTTATQYMAASFRTIAPEAGYRFYRLKLASNNGGGTIVGTHELGLRESLGGASVAVGAGGLATASRADLAPAMAFDGSAASGNGWADTSANAVNTKWLMYDFGSANSANVVQYTVASYPTSSSTAARSPNSWTLQASNDLITWDDLDTVSGETGWTLTEERVFTL